MDLDHLELDDEDSCGVKIDRRRNGGSVPLRHQIGGQQGNPRVSHDIHNCSSSRSSRSSSSGRTIRPHTDPTATTTTTTTTTCSAADEIEVADTLLLGVERKITEAEAVVGPLARKKEEEEKGMKLRAVVHDHHHHHLRNETKPYLTGSKSKVQCDKNIKQDNSEEAAAVTCISKNKKSTTASSPASNSSDLYIHHDDILAEMRLLTQELTALKTSLDRCFQMSFQLEERFREQTQRIENPKRLPYKKTY